MPNGNLLKPVLVVEDDKSTAELERNVLLRCGKTSRIAVRAADAILKLKQEQFSVVLLDYVLNDEDDAWQVLKAAQAAVPPIPVIIVTGRGNEQVAVEALRRGAADYIVKTGEFWENLPAIVERVERSGDAEYLRSCLAALVESSGDAIIGKTADGKICSWNTGAEQIYGYTCTQARVLNITELFPSEQRPGMIQVLERLKAGERIQHFETIGLRCDGRRIDISISISPVRDDAGSIISTSLIVRDISERNQATEKLRQTEDQLRQLQKMEAVGQLAGGMAHEYNNLLTVINGRAELMRSRLSQDNPMRRQLDLVLETGERAATLTRQLLAFSRRQVLQPKILNLNATVDETHEMLKRIIGEDIRLLTNLAPELGHVHADPGHIEQVIVNLASNARDAMASGGDLTIETANVDLDGEFVRMHPGAKLGPYVMLAVTDTGCGIDADDLTHIFEPFFTTKGKAKRAGLGLSMVYGIIKQSEGYICAISQPGQGARFEIYLPRVAAAEPGRRYSVGAVPAENRTILIVEDEEGVLELTTEILKDQGYTVLSETSAQKAILLAGQHPGFIDLLLTDVVMPGMNGRELATRLTSVRKDMKVLFMSGYTENANVSGKEGGAGFISKPFTPDDLKRKIREVLYIPRGL